MLPFTADVLFSSFEAYNRALWPLPILAFVLALGTILATLRPTRLGDRTTAALLAAAWLWIGYGYHYRVRAGLDFAALGYASLFLIQGLLLAWSGVVRGRLRFAFRRDFTGWAGLGLALTAAVVLPLADALTQGLASARLVGLAPGPTALWTLGLLLLNERAAPVHLTIVPGLWAAAAGATGWILAVPQDIAAAVAGLGAFALGLRARWRG